ncbi:MAG: gamma-glutamyltransferase [Verrucomicrobiaceae bacterium]|nr:gamma-glutamyltransferase [Verrucomicrobiaceae bacterium]
MIRRNPSAPTRRCALVAVLPLLLLCAAPAFPQSVDPSDPGVAREIGDRFGPGASGPYVARNGMVSTASHQATMAALETLRAGGNAFDAAAVAQFVLNVTEPYASGIGGGAFLVLYDAETGKVRNIDGREEAPRGFHADSFRDADGKLVPFNERITGGHSVGVPGTLAAMAHLLENYGTIRLAEALEPAIRIAREGFIVTEPFARNIRSHVERLSLYPASARLFFRPDGTPLQAGDRFRNPDFADTLERIAWEGLSAFYEGEIAEDIVKTVREDTRRPGLLTLEDLANYRPVEREPVSVRYRGYDVYGMNLPSSGGITLGLMLNLLEASDFAEAPPFRADSIHRMADAQNLAFADRNRYLGDADFVDVPSQGLLDKHYAKERAELLETERALPTSAPFGVPPGAPVARADATSAPEPVSTTHFTVVDRDRNVASVTTTIEQHFGSGLVVPGRGFLLNNELTDFDAEALDEDGNPVPNAPDGERKTRRTALGDAAETEGGKRPRSSMTPTIVLRDGKPRFALGSPGGSQIIGITLNVLLNLVDHDMDVQAAINAPRAIARNGPLELEAPLFRDRELREELERRGFTVRDAQAIGSVQAIEIGEDGWLRGAADPRREGLAVGY